ncbi:MAG: putative Ig domain-containing protein [Acidobacteriota bacterium]
MNVQDSNGATGSRAVQLVVVGTVLTLGPATLPPATFNQAYSGTLTATGGTAPYFFELIGGTLPSGLLLQANSIVGTPTTNQTLDYSFTLRATDQHQATGTRVYTLHVTSSGQAVISIAPATLPNAARGEAYAATLTATGGQAPYIFSMDAGSQLPPGIELTPDGSMAGSATVAGSYTFTIRVTDANGIPTARTYNFIVMAPDAQPPVISAITLPPAEQNLPTTATLQATGGAPPYLWQISEGSAPPGVALSGAGVLQGTPVASGQFAFTVSVTDSNGASASTTLQWSVKAAAVVNTLFFDVPKLSFALPFGNTTSAPQCLTVFATKSAATVQIAAEAAWAAANANSLQTPGSVCVAASAASLAVGVYDSQLRLTTSQAQPSAYTVPMSLSIQSAAPANVSAAPALIRVSLTKNSPAANAFLVLSNSGGSASTFAIQSSSASWLTVAQSAGVVAAGSSTTAPIALDPAGLAAGVYSTNLTIETPTKTSTVAVELSVSDAPGLLALSTSSLEFVAWTGGATGSGSLGLVNQGAIAMEPTIVTNTSDAGHWLNASIAPGSLAAGSATPITVVVDPANLQPGRYSGSLSASSPSASNGPQLASVGLTVLPVGALVPDEATLYGLALTPASPEGTILLNVTPGGALTYTSAVAGSDSAWLSLSPMQGTVPVSGALTMKAKASAAATTPGLHTATVSVGFSDGTVRSLPVDFFVPSTAAGLPARSAVQFCGVGVPFVAHLLAPVPGFAAKTGRPVALKVQAENCDASAASGLSVTIHAGDTDLTLLPEQPGVWSGSWTPATAKSAIVLTATIARAGTAPGTASLAVQGSVSAGIHTEAVMQAVVSAASPVLDRPVAPASWITIYGSNLSSTTETAQSFPFPSSLGGVQISMGDGFVPLYFVSPGQINAIAPKALSPGVPYQLVLRQNGVAAVPLTVTVTDVNPAIFTVNQQGTGQAAAVLTGTRTIAGAGNPIARGAALELYMTGLGAVENAPEDGAPASLTVLAGTLQPVTATVGGRPASVLFAGLTPGAAGLYQVNLTIPEDAPIGDAIPVVVKQNGTESNIGTIAIR